MLSRLALVALSAAAIPAPALAVDAARDNIDALIEAQARANKVPSAFVHKVVKRESNYNAHAKGGSALGLMQIKHATARGMGYKGDAAGLYDPETNLKYGIAYLAGAYRAAKGDLDQAYRYYNRGYYYAAKRLGITTDVPDDGSDGASAVASSSSDFGKLFGLRSGQTAPATAVASADPQAGVAGTAALAFAPQAPAGAVEVPLPPRRPAALGGGEAVGQGQAAQVQVVQAQPAQAQPLLAAAGPSDLVAVPLPPRRPAGTVLAAAGGRPAGRKSAAPEVLEATALPAAQ